MFVLEHRGVRIELRLLRNQRHAHIGCEPLLAVIERCGARKNPEQRGLAAVIVAHEPDALLRIELKTDAVEQRDMAVSKRGFFQSEQRHCV